MTTNCKDCEAERAKREEAERALRAQLEAAEKLVAIGTERTLRHVEELDAARARSAPNDRLRQECLALAARLAFVADHEDREAQFPQRPRGDAAGDLRRANAKFLRGEAEAITRIVEETDHG